MRKWKCKSVIYDVLIDFIVDSLIAQASEQSKKGLWNKGNEPTSCWTAAYMQVSI